MKKIAMRSALAETTWTDAFRRVRNRIALVAAAICVAAAPLSSFAAGATLTHRWSFTSDYTDSVGGVANGSVWGSNNTFANGQVTFPGGGWGSGSVDLGGSGLTGGGDTTIEIWAKNNALSAAEVMFEYGAPKNNYGGWGGSKQCFAYYWSDENAQGNDIFIVKKGNFTSYSSKSGIMPATVGTMYHFSFTFKADGNGGTVVNFARRNATTGALEASGTHTVSDWTLSHLESQTPSFSLNISKEPQFKPAANAYNGSSSRYSDSNATYDEVRIWNGVLSDDQLAANASMGPDVYASGLTEGFELAAGTKFNVPNEGYTASGVVILGAGSKLRFDSAKFQGQTVTFSAAGYSVPSGSILDYVELTDPFNFTVSLSGNTITVAPVSVASSAVDYFVEWVQPSSPNLYVDTGVRGKTGVKAELQFLFSRPGNERYPVMLGSWGSKRFNLVMNNYDQSRWEYGESMSDLGGLAYEGSLCSAEVEVSAAGLMSGTWINSQGTKITPTKDAVSGQGVIDTGLNLYLFASNKNGTPSQCSQSRLYYCRLREGDTGAWTLSRNLRPCVKDGVAGLYDYVTGEVHYPVSSVANCVLVAGPVAYDRIATWNGGATPTSAELGTAANWTCTDKSGASLQSAVPDRTTLAVFPAGIGSVTLPSGYAAPWGAVRAEGGVAHPATQYGTYTQGRFNVVVPAFDYTTLGEGSLSGLVKVNGATSAINFSGKQVRHDGWFYVNAAQAGTWAMTLYVDDYYAFYIDDVQVLSYHTYSGGVAGAAKCEVSEGWHRFTSIIGDTGGGWGTGTTFGSDKVPFTFVVNGTTYSLTDNVTFPKGSGASTITLTADANWSALGKVALQGGARIDLNGHTLVVDDILSDDYIDTVITNSAAKNSVLYFLGEPLESKAAGIIKQHDENIILAQDGDQIATWTGAANDGNPATAGNWEDIAGQPVVPTAAHAVKITGSNVNLQCPAGTDIACKSFEIGNCTFTANCDWRGLSQTPTITGTADLNGHNLHLPHLAAVTGGSFANSAAGTTNEVRFTASDASYASFGESLFIDGIANLSMAGNVRMAILKDGGEPFTSSGLSLGNQPFEVDFVHSDGAANHAGASIGISGHRGAYRMSGGSLKATGEFKVGPTGEGEFVQTGGNVTLQNWFNLGRNANGNGTYTITGGKLLVNKASNSGADKVYLACASNSKGTLNVGGNGEVELRCGLSIGAQLDSNGGKGYVNVSGNGNLLTTGNLWIGQTNGETGEFRQTGGIAQCNGTTYVCNEDNSSGLLDISGTGEYRAAGGMTVGANGTLNVHDGGRLVAKSISTSKSTAKAMFDGGTIVATNVTDGANFISGLNNVTYGPGGLTLDTAAYNVTMATASNVLASAGSTFTKTGNGTLTVGSLPQVDAVSVAKGTLALTASYDNTAMLAHRWSFTSDLTDSVTGTAGGATASAGVTYSDGKASLTGGNKGTCYINLGANKLPSDSVTLEFWTTITTRKVWTKMFCLGKDSGSCLAFTFNRNSDSGVSGLDVAPNGGTYTGTGTLDANTPYYLAFTLKPNASGGTEIKGYCYNATTGALVGSLTQTLANWSLIDKIIQQSFCLGYSFWNDPDAYADYDEVRVWSGALSADAIALSAQKGPDATAADIAEIVAASPADRTLRLESGTTLDIGAGNTLTQPAVNANGTLASGSLVVTKQFNVTPGQSMTVASGATLDLTGADIVVTGEIPAGGCVIATAPSGGIVTAKPRKLTGGYWLYLKSGKARIGKRPGVTIIAY